MPTKVNNEYPIGIEEDVWIQEINEKLKKLMRLIPSTKRALSIASA